MAEYISRAADPTLEVENATLRARVEELERVLGMVEWADDGECLWCHGYSWDIGHIPDCPRQAALGKQ